MYRYVCPNCLRTFIDKIFNESLFCWKCGQSLVVIPSEKTKTPEKDL